MSFIFQSQRNKAVFKCDAKRFDLLREVLDSGQPAGVCPGEPVFLGGAQIPGADPGAAGSGKKTAPGAEKGTGHLAVFFRTLDRQGQAGGVEKQQVF